MFDPWAVVDASLEAAIPPMVAPFWGHAKIGDVNIGDIAICLDGNRLRYIYYDFLVSQGYVLTEQEQEHFSEVRWSSRLSAKLALRQEGRPYGRPCIVLERHSPGSFKVCFLATLQESSSVYTYLGIPEEDLRAYPSFPPRLRNPGVRGPEQSIILPMPVIRSNLFSSRDGIYRRQLHYGELERVRALIKQKLEVCVTATLSSPNY
jgi:hypothetical protein